jgi:hypothetical protein
LNAAQVEIYCGKKQPMSWKMDASENLNRLQPKIYLEFWWFFLSGTIQDYMCEYMKQQSESLKGYLIATFDSREHYLSLLDQSLGTSTKSEDIKLCEMMASAGLFREEIKITRDGRNHYKLFYLTDTGREIAKKIKEEGYSGPIPQSTPIDNI